MSWQQTEEGRAYHKEYSKRRHTRLSADPAYRKARLVKRGEYVARMRTENPELLRTRALATTRKRLPKPTRPEPSTCDACGAAPSGRWKSLCLDHCHENNIFRGWLCHRCNRALGLAGDTLEAMERLISYLRKSQCPASNQ